MQQIHERGFAHDRRPSAAVMAAADIREHVAAPRFKFEFSCVGPREDERRAYVALRDRLEGRRCERGSAALLDVRAIARELALFRLETKWDHVFLNTVLTTGKNDLLDKYFAGSAYTAAWYMLVISSSGYSAINALDTMASHAGWTESTAYSNSNRPTCAFSAASAGSKALSSALAFNINATDTLKGAGIVTNNTKGGSTGILYSAGLFSGGDRPVINGDTVNSSGSWSV